MDNKEKYLVTYTTHNDDNTNMALHVYGIYSTNEKANVAYYHLVNKLLNDKNKRYEEEKNLFFNSLKTINNMLDNISDKTDGLAVDDIRDGVNSLIYKSSIVSEYTEAARNDIISDMHVQITKIFEDDDEDFILCKNY